MPDTSTHLTTKEFADRTGISASTVSQHLRDGKIEGKKESGRWMIPASEVDRFNQGEAGGAGKTGGRKEPKPAPAQKPAAETPGAAAGGKTYTVEEFSRLTFLTPSGVRKYLREGILIGARGADGQWQVAAENLESGRIRHLIR